MGCSNEANEYVLPNICVEYPNEQQGGGDLHALPPPLDVFQTNYYDMYF